MLHFTATALCAAVGIGWLAKHRLGTAMLFFALMLVNAGATAAAALWPEWSL